MYVSQLTKGETDDVRELFIIGTTREKRWGEGVRVGGGEGG